MFENLENTNDINIKSISNKKNIKQINSFTIKKLINKDVSNSSNKNISQNFEINPSNINTTSIPILLYVQRMNMLLEKKVEEIRLISQKYKTQYEK